MRFDEASPVSAASVAVQHAAVWYGRHAPALHLQGKFSTRPRDTVVLRQPWRFQLKLIPGQRKVAHQNCLPHLLLNMPEGDIGT